LYPTHNGLQHLIPNHHPTPLTSIAKWSKRVYKVVSLQDIYFSIVGRRGCEASPVGSVLGAMAIRSECDVIEVDNQKTDRLEQIAALRLICVVHNIADFHSAPASHSISVAGPSLIVRALPSIRALSAMRNSS